MKKTVAFIDGLNLYHSLPKQYTWLNLKKLCQFFLKKSETLTDIYYFTTLAKWDEGKVKRHKRYIKALETTDVKVIYGNFKTVTKKCKNCFKEEEALLGPLYGRYMSFFTRILNHRRYDPLYQTLY